MKIRLTAVGNFDGECKFDEIPELIVFLRQQHRRITIEKDARRRQEGR